MSNYFYYTLLLPHGKVRTGIAGMAVERTASATKLLEKKYDGVVLSIRKLPDWCGKFGEAARRLSARNPKPVELAGLLRDLAVMTGSGINVIDAVKACMEDESTPGAQRVSRVCRQLIDDLNAGLSVGASFERQADVFPETVRSLAHIGDETGRMNEMLMESASHLERIQSLKSDAQQALIYPLISFLTIFGAVGFWLVYVMPKLVSLFKQLNAKLPPLTKFVLASAEWLGKYWQLFAFGSVLLVVSVVVIWKSSPIVRRTVMNLLHKAPIARTLLVSSGLAFFSEYLSLLIRSGMDLVNSLTLLEKSTSNVYYRERIGAMRSFLERGDRLSFAMRQVGGFPSMMVRMITVGEESGTLDKQLSYLANEYSVRLKRVVSMLAEIIKPLIVVIAGGVLLFFIVALLLPVYDLVRQTMSLAH